MPFYTCCKLSKYEAVDSGEASARLFFADFTKGFNLIYYTIIRELAKLEVHPVLLNWIATFLTNRQRAVRIGGTLSKVMNTVMDGPHTEETKFTCGYDRLRIEPAGDYEATGMETRQHT